MKTTGFLYLSWPDKRLEWFHHPEYEGKIRSLFTTEDQVWKPALIIQNSVTNVGVVSDKGIPMRIADRGLIHWDPAGIYDTDCEVVATYFPFDTQKCSIIISTRGYSNDEVSLKFFDPAYDMSSYRPNGEWDFIEIINESEEKEERSNKFSSLTFTIVMQRRPFFRVVNMILPPLLLSFLSAMVFKLPAESGEKIGYSLTVLLAYAVYLTLISSEIPATSLTISILSIYLLIILLLGVQSVILSILVLECFHTLPGTEVTGTTRKIISGFLIHFTGVKIHRSCCGSNKVKTVTKSELDVKGVSVHLTDGTLTWQDVSTILDSFFLRLYLCIVTASTIILIVSFVYGFNV